MPDRLWLFHREQIKADMVSYTSDRFEEFKEYALGMIKKGEAYMDDTPQVGKRSMFLLCCSRHRTAMGFCFVW